MELLMPVRNPKMPKTVFAGTAAANIVQISDSKCEVIELPNNYVQN